MDDSVASSAVRLDAETTIVPPSGASSTSTASLSVLPISLQVAETLATRGRAPAANMLRLLLLVLRYAANLVLP
jgi:hypothetical protein